MKSIKVWLCSVMMAWPLLLNAGELIELSRAQIEAQRQMIVSFNLNLTDEAGATFWPLYREYHNKRSMIDDERYALLEQYAAAYNKNAVTDELAGEWLKKHFKFEKDILKLKEKYMKKFSKSFPESLVVRYFQIENRLDTALKFKISSELPLIELAMPEEKAAEAMTP